jgi:hypothetical protein
MSNALSLLVVGLLCATYGSVLLKTEAWRGLLTGLGGLIGATLVVLFIPGTNLWLDLASFSIFAFASGLFLRLPWTKALGIVAFAIAGSFVVLLAVGLYRSFTNG